MRVRAFSKTIAGFVAAVALLATSRVEAQERTFVVPVTAGSGLEQYQRALTMIGWHPDSGKPWRGRVQTGRRQGLSILAPRVGGVLNSSFPYGFNDGPTWAGKGLTATISGGAQYNDRRWLSVVANPTAFIAQNAEFSIASNGRTGDRQFADWTSPDYIDRPQRFGTSSYGRIDPGESEVRLEAFGLAAGFSSRAEVWGPAFAHPLVLGNNAGGIPRLFAGTGKPLRVGHLTVDGHVFWGQLLESSYGADTGVLRKHFATAGVATLGIAGTGVQLGATRFFHVAWPTNGIRHAPWLRLVQTFLSSNPSIGYNPDNQLASIFLRIAPPSVGFEVYGEYGRDDRNASGRDLLLEPDHISAYTLGFARAWGASDSSYLTVVRGEVLNSRISHLQQQRSQAAWYTHIGQFNGHTHRGQVLASAGGFGGGASVLAVDRFSRRGRFTVRWDRVNHATKVTEQGLPIADRTDVFHALGIEQTRFIPLGELTVGGTVVREFNRYFGGDSFNAQVRVELTIIR